MEQQSGPSEDGCPKCKKKSRPAQKPKSLMKSLMPKSKDKNKNNKNNNNNKSDTNKAKPKKDKKKVNYCDLFTRVKGELGTERHNLGVPPDTKISIDMKLADLDKLCQQEESNPKLIINRLKR